MKEISGKNNYRVNSKRPVNKVNVTDSTKSEDIKSQICCVVTDAIKIIQLRPKMY